MAYKLTGRPVGRPKTKEYQTISLKMPQELLNRVHAYAQQYGQTVSGLIREGLAWRISDGDHQARLTPGEEYTFVPGPIEGYAYLPALPPADEGAALLPTRRLYAQATVVDISGNTGIREGQVAANTVIPEHETSYDTSKFYLGKLCPYGHAWQGTGQSLRRVSKGDCRRCGTGSVRKARQRTTKAAC